MKTLKGMYSGGEVTTEIHPIEIVDDHAVLTIDFTLDPGGESTGMGYAMQANSDRKGSGGIRLVDLEKDRVWSVGYDAEGVPAATRGWLTLKQPGQSITTVTMFGAPDGDQVDVLLPGVGLVQDVPVVEGGSDAPSIASLELSGEVTFPKAAPLGTYTKSYRDGVSASGKGDEQMVTLSSDVLFDTDQYVLTADAERVVAEAGAAIKAGSGRKVQVVGHTDDVLSEEYNQELSVKRAQSVADRLGQDLGSGFTIVSEGKGESQPAVQGTDAEARAANRRVEISFTSTRPVEFEESQVPEPQVPVSSGNEPVEHLDFEDRTLSVSVAKVVRRDGYLIGSFDVSLVKGESGFPYRWFGYGKFNDNLAQQDREYGAWPVYMLTDGGKVYAARYYASWGKKEFSRFLADTVLVNGDIALGRVFRYDVIWPDPGTDTISVEAQDAFRIIDIPVVDG